MRLLSLFGSNKSSEPTPRSSPDIRSNPSISAQGLGSSFSTPAYGAPPPASPNKGSATRSLPLLWRKLTSAALRFEQAAVGKVNRGASTLGNRNTVTVGVKENGATRAHELDAISININRPRGGNTAARQPVERHYLWGKSPLPSNQAAFATCEKFIVQGVVSGQGVFQFSSQKAHFRPDESSEKPLIGALQQQWRSHRENGTSFILGGRFEVMSMDPEVPRQPLAPGQEPRAEDMHLECQLSVIDRQDASGEVRVVPLTQVGLKFKNRCLQSRQIMQAHNILQDHQKRCINVAALADAQPQSLPMIASAAGRGRGPALIVFSEIYDRINAGLVNDTGSIETALIEVINDGRKARIEKDIRQGRPPDLGGFVHSPAQLQEIKIALEEHLDNKIALEAVRRGFNVASHSLVNHAPAALHEHRFSLLQNNGKGDCLFHALEGNEQMPSLHPDQIATIRENVASAMFTENRSRNAHEINEARMQEDPDFVPTVFSMSNDEMAAFQSEPGRIAGYMELKQWLNIRENHHKTVVMLDTLRGGEMIDIFTRVVDPRTGEIGIDIKRTKLAPSELQGSMSKEEICNIVGAAIYGDNLDRHNGPRTIPPARIVLYRTLGHFARLTGIKSESEMEEDAVRRAEDYQKQLEAGKDPTIDYQTLGFDTH